MKPNLLKTHYEYALTLLTHPNVPLFDVYHRVDHTITYETPIVEHLQSAINSIYSCLDIRHPMVNELVEHLKFCIDQINESATVFLTNVVDSQKFQSTFYNAPINQQTIEEMRQYVYVVYREALARGEIR